MKIAIIGTHGTFKTTLTYFLAGVLKSRARTVGIVSEVASFCPYLKDGKGDLIAQTWILLTQAQKEREKQDIYEYVVCDRSVVDNFIYALDYCRTNNLEVPGWMELFVLHHLKSYNFLFKTPLNQSGLINDGIRNTDLEWQRRIDDLLTYYLKEKNIPFYSLPSNMESKDNVIDYSTLQAMYMARKITDMDTQTKIT